MTRHDPETIDTLNRLIAACKDGQGGFRAAAENAHSPELRRLLKHYATQRTCFASELQAEVRRLGARPRTSGSVSGTLHHAWARLRSTLLGPSDVVLAGECARGEAAAMQAYEDAGHKVLPQDLQVLVARQYKEIKDAHERLRDLAHAEVPAT
jgi:uncharacterized protein (TIGR02284 family)